MKRWMADARPWADLLCLRVKVRDSEEWMATSDRLGWREGSYREEEDVISEQRRKPKKASRNMASRVVEMAGVR